MVYEDIYDAKAAADHLSGFNVANRYLIVLFYAPARQAKKLDQARRPVHALQVPCCSADACDACRSKRRQSLRRLKRSSPRSSRPRRRKSKRRVPQARAVHCALRAARKGPFCR